MNAAGDVSFAQKALVKSGESDDASSGAALDSGAPQDAAAAEAETTEPEPEKPAIYKYKPKLHMQDRSGKYLGNASDDEGIVYQQALKASPRIHCRNFRGIRMANGLEIER